MKEITELYKSSKRVRTIVLSLSVLIVALIIFRAGISVGYHKAAFSYRLGENYYYRAFSPNKGPMMGIGFAEFDRDDLTSGHGAIGKIVKINLPTFVVSSPDNIEKIVTINDDTQVRRFRDTASSSDLRLDESVIVIGTPDDNGQIVAKLIRLIPPPPEMATSTKK